MPIRVAINGYGRIGRNILRAHYEGGKKHAIDIVAINPAPVVGGKLVVQCERQAGLVGVSVVRDLYGAVTHERATKGLLVSTSDFSADARRFAEGKPLELINGPQLAQLLEEHGLFDQC